MCQQTLFTMFVPVIWLGLMAHLAHSNQVYTADWSALDSRPLPRWFDEAKFGIFLHWGVFSVPSYATDHIWFYDKLNNVTSIETFMANYPEGFQYEQFAPMFKAEFFDPNQWAAILESSGAKYVIMTSNFFDGFAMWDSPYSDNWTSVKTGPKKDLVEDLANAIRKSTELRFGVYYAQGEWFHPLYLQDKAKDFTTTEFRDKKFRPELKKLVKKFKPDILCLDGLSESQDKYWNNSEMLIWLYNTSPVKDTIVTNDKWHPTETCEHGDFQTCEERCLLNSKKKKYRKWEYSMRIAKGAYSYRREANLGDYATIKKIITQLAKTVSCGGNLRLAIPPTHDGRITPICQERLLEIGNWLQINGQAIYKSTAWHVRDIKDQTNGIWYTQRDCKVYAIFLNWPTHTDDLLLNAPEPTKCTAVWLLGDKTTPIRYKPEKESKGMVVRLPRLQDLPNLLSQPAWVLSLSNLANRGENCSNDPPN